jgi:3-hydroxyisobutyrate dehydrogenase
MGSAMAHRLVDCGHTVTVWDRKGGDQKQWGEDGIAVADDPASAVADVDVVITMVTNGKAVEDVAGRMLDAMPEDAVWVQTSTVGADWADRLRALADDHGRAMLDVPVSGSTAPARDGALTCIVSGPEPALAAARPVLEALGSRVQHVGTGQEASRIKLVVNTWMTAVTVAMADSLAACDRIGVDPDRFLDVVRDGPLAMPYALEKAEHMTSGDYTAGFPVELALKDVRLTEEAEREQPPLVHAVEERLSRAADAGHGRDDLAAVRAVQ